MNFEDLKWAFRELMKPPRHRSGCACEVHEGASTRQSAWACTEADGESPQGGTTATDGDDKPHPE